MSTINLHLLKKKRQSKGWSQDVLSHISGISKRTIQRIESGNPASMETAMALASAFDLKEIKSLSVPDVGKNENITPTPSFSTNKSSLVITKEMAQEMISKTMIFAVLLLGSYFLIEHLELPKEQSSLTFALIWAPFLVAFGFFATRKYNPNKKEAYEERRFLMYFLKLGGRVLPKKESLKKTYPLSEENFVIGINQKNNRMIRHLSEPFDASSVFVGGNLSGIETAVAGQMLMSLKKNRPGVIFANKESHHFVHLIKMGLIEVQRDEDFYSVDVEDIVDAEHTWWRDLFQKNKVCVVLFDSSDKKPQKAALDNLLSALSTPLPNESDKQHSSDSKVFTCFSSQCVENINHLTEKLTLCRRQNGLITFFMIDNPIDVAERFSFDFINYFGQKYILKQDDFSIAQSISKNLGSQYAHKYLKHSPGEASYFYKDIAWEEVKLLYFDPR